MINTLKVVHLGCTSGISNETVSSISKVVKKSDVSYISLMNLRYISFHESNSTSNLEVGLA